MGVAKAGRGWVLAPCLVAMEAEANRIAPRRSIASDGSIGDQAHAARTSDHNPSGGVVHALDLTHDPAGGWDAHAHAQQVAANVVNGVERRIKYIISRGRIFSQKSGRWAWRPYTGANPHNHHAHFSVNDHIGDVSPWFGSVPPFPSKPVPPVFTPAISIEEDDMHCIIICEGKGIAHVVTGGRFSTITVDELKLIREAYKKISQPLLEMNVTARRWAQLGLG